MYNAIMETLEKYNTMAIQDDYPSWKAHNFHREAAKLLLIDQHEESNTIPIFFDDNCDDFDGCIVDVRDYRTHEIVPFDKMINRFAIRSTPPRAIQEKDYFLKCIKEVLAKYHDGDLS